MTVRWAVREQVAATALLARCRVCRLIKGVTVTYWWLEYQADIDGSEFPDQWMTSCNLSHARLRLCFFNRLVC